MVQIAGGHQETIMMDGEYVKKYALKSEIAFYKEVFGISGDSTSKSSEHDNFKTLIPNLCKIEDDAPT